MKTRAMVIGLCVLAVSWASLLDTNDLKNNTNMALGGNPAVAAENSASKIQLGTAFISILNQNSKILNTNGLAGITAKGMNPTQFSEATKFIDYTGKINDVFYVAKYAYVPNFYNMYDAKSNFNQDMKYTVIVRDAIESNSIVLSKKINPTLSIGCELATNKYVSEKNVNFNAVAESAGNTDYSSYYESTQYYTLMLGLINKIDSMRKLSISHKFSQSRGLFYNKYDATSTAVRETYNDVEYMPNETAIGYVYTVNNDLELAATLKTFWGVSYSTSKTNTIAQDSITKRPYNSYGLAADYKLANNWSTQFFSTFIRNYKAKEVNGDLINTDRGWNVTQLGFNIQNKITKDSSLLFGIDDTKLLSEEPDFGWLIENTRYYLTYSYTL